MNQKHLKPETSECKIIYVYIYIYIYIYKIIFMEDVQRNSHAQTRNNATDKINGEENEFQKREIWK